MKNAPLIRYIAAHLHSRSRRGQQVLFEYVKAHCGIEGNEGADAQANIGATMPATDEKDWDTLEKELLQQVEQELKAAKDPIIPVPVLVQGDDSGFKSREPVESPQRHRVKPFSTSGQSHTSTDSPRKARAKPYGTNRSPVSTLPSINIYPSLSDLQDKPKVVPKDSISPEVRYLIHRSADRAYLFYRN